MKLKKGFLILFSLVIVSISSFPVSNASAEEPEDDYLFEYSEEEDDDDDNFEYSDEDEEPDDVFVEESIYDDEDEDEDDDDTPY